MVQLSKRRTKVLFQIVNSPHNNGASAFDSILLVEKNLILPAEALLIADESVFIVNQEFP